MYKSNYGDSINREECCLHSDFMFCNDGMHSYNFITLWDRGGEKFNKDGK